MEWWEWLLVASAAIVFGEAALFWPILLFLQGRTRSGRRRWRVLMSRVAAYVEDEEPSEAESRLAARRRK